MIIVVVVALTTILMQVRTSFVYCSSSFILVATTNFSLTLVLIKLKSSFAPKYTFFSYKKGRLSARVLWKYFTSKFRAFHFWASNEHEKLKEREEAFAAASSNRTVLIMMSFHRSERTDSVKVITSKGTLFLSKSKFTIANGATQFEVTEPVLRNFGSHGALIM